MVSSKLTSGSAFDAGSVFRSGSGAVVLDGGLASQLEASGCDLRSHLWSAKVLAESPSAIVDAHRAYYAAGAQIATTASYQASITGFTALGLSPRRAMALIADSVRLARIASDEYAAESDPRWVAASVGPYGAVLSDGSEYRGGYDVSRAQLAEFHRPRLEVLAAAEPDLLAIETIPDLDEALVVLEALDGIAIPAWVSFTVDGDRTSAGQPLAEAFAAVAEHPNVIAVGVNCCAPEQVTSALQILRTATDKPGVVYPNGGRRWDAEARRWIGSVRFPIAEVSGWLSLGARFVGGCCETGPADIRAIAELLGQDAEADVSSKATSQPR